MYIYQTTTERAVRTDPHIGTTVELHATAGGKAYLAHLPADRRNDLLDRLDLVERTESTFTDQEAFEAEPESVREQEFAYNDEERFVGMWTVGAPVQGPGGEVLAAISVSGPTTRMDGEWYWTELSELVQETARVIGIRVTDS